MNNPSSATDAVAFLERSVLPTVLTEGSTDYRAMRKVERNLADLQIDFLPLGGRDMVLQVWSGLSLERRKSVIALVDLDCWLYHEIPDKYQDDMIIYTAGYSIENDLFLDSNIFDLMSDDEQKAFSADLMHVCAYHAREIELMKKGDPYHLKTKAHKIIAEPDITASLTSDELKFRDIMVKHFGQILRGKTLLELLSMQLSRKGREIKFGYGHIYEIMSSRVGKIFNNTEQEIRNRISEAAL